MQAACGSFPTLCAASLTSARPVIRSWLPRPWEQQRAVDVRDESEASSCLASSVQGHVPQSRTRIRFGAPERLRLGGLPSPDEPTLIRKKQYVALRIIIVTS